MKTHRNVPTIDAGARTGIGAALHTLRAKRARQNSAHPVRDGAGMKVLCLEARADAVRLSVGG